MLIIKYPPYLFYYVGKHLGILVKGYFLQSGKGHANSSVRIFNFFFYQNLFMLLEIKLGNGG